MGKKELSWLGFDYDRFLTWDVEDQISVIGALFCGVVLENEMDVREAVERLCNSFCRNRLRVSEDELEGEAKFRAQCWELRNVLKRARRRNAREAEKVRERKTDTEIDS